MSEQVTTAVAMRRNTCDYTVVFGHIRNCSKPKIWNTICYLPHNDAPHTNVIQRPTKLAVLLLQNLSSLLAISRFGASTRRGTNLNIALLCVWSHSRPICALHAVHTPSVCPVMIIAVCSKIKFACTGSSIVSE